MNIDWITPCRFVEVHDNLATIIGAGIDTLWVEELPAQVQVMFAIHLRGMVEELDPEIKHAFTNRVQDPQGKVIGEAAGEIAIGAQSARLEWLTGITLPLAVGFEAAKEGAYTFEFSFDDAEKSLPIHVVVGQPGAASDSE